jgi:hypothetical protein
VALSPPHSRQQGVAPVSQHGLVLDSGHDEVEPAGAAPEPQCPRLGAVWERRPERVEVPLGLFSGRTASVQMVIGDERLVRS